MRKQRIARTVIRTACAVLTAAGGLSASSYGTPQASADNCLVGSLIGGGLNVSASTPSYVGGEWLGGWGTTYIYRTICGENGTVKLQRTRQGNTGNNNYNVAGGYNYNVSYGTGYADHYSTENKMRVPQ